MGCVVGGLGWVRNYDRFGGWGWHSGDCGGCGGGFGFLELELEGFVLFLACFQGFLALTQLFITFSQLLSESGQLIQLRINIHRSPRRFLYVLLPGRRSPISRSLPDSIGGDSGWGFANLQ